MSGIASTFPFKDGKIWTKSDTVQITNRDGVKVFARGLSCYTTAGLVFVRMRGSRMKPTDAPNNPVTTIATDATPVYLALGSWFIGEFDLVYSTGATAVDFVVWFD